MDGRTVLVSSSVRLRRMTSLGQNSAGRAMTATSDSSMPATTAGWFADPLEVHELRYFDGSTWTDHVTHSGPLPCSGCHPRAVAAGKRGQDRRSDPVQALAGIDGKPIIEGRGRNRRPEDQERRQRFGS